MSVPRSRGKPLLGSAQSSPARYQSQLRPAPVSLVVKAVNKYGRQHHAKSTSYDKTKNIFLFVHKIYSSPTLQFRITNYQALMADYNHTNCSKFITFIEHLPEEQCKQFQSVINKCQLPVRSSLEASLDATDTAACSIATAVVLCQTCWL
ncbi:hypothetical protein UY3_11907 [Chelonia mydas]|uniref:Uncharacterized protein n=1 Tax=Chelonia mydas TaxID=8469 RepID=M7B5V9_CHEMY|nr:hypothetical protein UY3_11907 [Chelonia mydas]